MVISIQIYTSEIYTDMIKSHLCVESPEIRGPVISLSLIASVSQFNIFPQSL